jgi:arabinofuranan 3-O-arabinosyltransferase
VRWLRSPTPWVMLGLTVLSFLQRPGQTTFDTKLDLAVDPVAFLGRALHLWNPAATGGELQNQAYGYLFPMGPYFALCQLAGIPPWIAQRLWGALLLCLAFYGTLAVARTLRIGSPAARYVGAVAYALAPRMITEIGPLSAEMISAAMLPWILLPLIKADRISSPRRAAGLSGIAVLCIGGINGAIVIMVLLVPALWLLTRQWTRNHAKLVLWWCGCVLAAVLWWLLPLALLGEYSLPFLDYIESAATTTTPMSLFQVLRGTDQWVAYVVQGGSPWWPSGFMLIDNPALILATGLVAAIGLAGLVRRGLPERLFLTIAVVSSLTLLTIGYVGALDSPLSGVVRGLLDGPLAPLRNVHKLEPGLRLPLMLAFMHAVSKLPSPAPGWAPKGRVVVAGALVLLMAAPVWLLTLRPGPGWRDIPEHWRSAMAWLGDNDKYARTLLVPGTGFGEYTWGKTVDEPAQALARSPWALRSQVPLGSEGNTRVMDAVEDALADGRGSPGLADFLARSGHRYLLLRNDIDRTNTDAPPLAVMHESLQRSPGIERVVSFGSEIEIYEVKRPVPRATAVNATDMATVAGGPESLLPLLDSGLLRRDQPAVLAGDGGAPEARDWLVTDGLRHRERNVGQVRDNLSQTLAADEQPRQNRPATDILPFQGIEHQTVAAYRGIRGVNASTASSFADSATGSDPSSMPFAAIDGDPFTAWHSSSVDGPNGQWWQVDLDTPRVLNDVGVQIVDDERVGWRVTRIRITTDAGSRDHEVARGGGVQKFVVPPGLTSKVRVTILAVAANRQTGQVGIAEVQIAGVTAQRALQVPSAGADQPTSFAFTRGSQPRFACTSADGPRCDADLTRFGEESNGIHRLFRVEREARYQVEGTVLPGIGGKIPVTLQDLTVSGSTNLAGDPAAAALSAVDGDPATTWIADYTDSSPTLKLSWPGARDITGLKLVTAATSGGSRPAEVEIRTPTQRKKVTVFSDGSVDFTGRTDSIEIVVTQTEAGLNPEVRNPGPAAISDIQLLGAQDVIRPIAKDTPFTVPCGAGPAVTINGTKYDTTVSGTLADFVGHRPLTLGTCQVLAEGIDLAAREHEISTARSESFVVQDLRLRPSGPAALAVRQRAVNVLTWDATDRRVQVDAGEAAVLTVPENANDGWVATVDGQPLSRTRVDGWQQAWLLPAGGAATVELKFVPDDSYRTRLLIGAAAAALLVLVTALPVRRRKPVITAPGGKLWIQIVLIGLLAALGGMLALVLLITCLLIRTAARRLSVSPVLAAGGMAVATGTVVVGRMSGLGQEWAYGTVAQAAILVAVAAVVSMSVDWFEPSTRPELDQRPADSEYGDSHDRSGHDLVERTVPIGQHQDDLDTDRYPRQQR